MSNNLNEQNNLIIYKNSEGDIKVEAIYKDETLWLSQKGMSKVFECSTDNISLHLKHIFEEKELDKKSVTEKCSLTADDGKNYNTTIYNLDAIIVVDYKKNQKMQRNLKYGLQNFKRIYDKRFCFK